MDYFSNRVGNLTHEDLLVLNELYVNDATSSYKSFQKRTIQNTVDLSAAVFRKTIHRLEAMGFIKISYSQKNHMLSLTDLGVLAIQQITEGVEV